MMDDKKEYKPEDEMKIFNANKTKTRDDDVGIPEDFTAFSYIISKKWMKKWKKYVGWPKKKYSGIQYKRQLDDELIEKTPSHPGPITNDDILDDSEKYLISEDPTDIFNVPLKPELKEGKDYDIINSKQWELLHSIYGGIQIPRKKQKHEFFDLVNTETFFEKIKLVVLPIRDSFSVNKITGEKLMSISKKNTIYQMKERVVRVLNHSLGMQLNLSSIRLWKLNYDNTLDQFKQNLLNCEEKIRSTIISNSGDCDENTGLEFSGVCLDLLLDKTIEKSNFFSYDIFVVERANEKGEFIFRYMKNAKIGSCAMCYYEKPLIVACKCKTKFYCSESCKIRDERYHKEYCPAYEISAVLSTMKREKDSKMGLIGLQNLGNTCFMNSGLQCLSNTWILTKYFLEDKYASEINKDNPFGAAGKMALSFAKLVKLLWYDNALSLSPIDIKRVFQNTIQSFFSSIKWLIHQHGGGYWK